MGSFGLCFGDATDTDSDRSDVGGAAQFNNIGPVPLSRDRFLEIATIGADQFNAIPLAGNFVAPTNSTGTAQSQSSGNSGS